MADPSSRPQLAVSAAIFRDGKILLVRRAVPPAYHCYTFPGGRVEYGETLSQALAREVSEETGLVIELDGGTHAGAEGYDARRTVWLEGQGYSVIRYLNSDVHDRPNDVKRGIATAIEAGAPHPGRQGATCPSPSRGEG